MRRIGLAAVLAISFALASLAAQAQQPGKVYRASVSWGSRPPTPRKLVCGRPFGWACGNCAGSQADRGAVESRHPFKTLEESARTLKVQLQPVVARNKADFESAFSTMTRARAQALLVFAFGPYIVERQRIAELALRFRLPTMFSLRDHAEAGGLMSYGTDFNELARRGAVYVDKILKGAKPADLPVEQPTKFELVINLKTAKALGLTIPQSLLLRADQVIQ